MSKNRDVRAILEAVKSRAAEDGRVIGMLDELDKLLIDVPDSDLSNQANGRSRLPYSSDPPSFEAIWN